MKDFVTKLINGKYSLPVGVGVSAVLVGLMLVYVNTPHASAPTVSDDNAPGGKVLQFTQQTAHQQSGTLDQMGAAINQAENQVVGSDTQIGVVFNNDPKGPLGTFPTFTMYADTTTPGFPFYDKKYSRSYLPIRYIGDQLGLSVGWNDATQTVTFTKSGLNVSLTVGQSNAEVNGKQVAIDAPCQMRGGRTYAPLRFVSEAFGASVYWEPAGTLDSSEDLVLINKPGYVQK